MYGVAYYKCIHVGGLVRLDTRIECRGCLHFLPLGNVSPFALDPSRSERRRYEEKILDICNMSGPRQFGTIPSDECSTGLAAILLVPLAKLH